MKLSNVPILFLILALVSGCGSSNGGSGSAPNGSSGSSTSNSTGGNASASSGGDFHIASPAANVLAVTVNGSLCSDNSYPNKPCVSVTVCTPGTTTCQTINDILLDTGSYGLRIFKQALNVPLPQVTGSSGSLAECVQFADGSSLWGPVQMASVILGNEPAVQVPIQVVGVPFGTPPLACRNADQTPADAGFNGILGVGLFAQDCGTGCTSRINNGIYYACSGAICKGTTVAMASQVQNPVTLLPQDNNGVIVQLPGVPPGGSPSANGSLVLGIGTQANNAPSAATTYVTDASGEFRTTLNGISYNSFIDSGSNGLFFSPPSASLLPDCTSPNALWFCPPSTLSFSTTNKGATGTTSGTVSFQIGNFISLTGSSNNVFSEIGGNSTGGFDWGIPFYFGREVYLGVEGKSSSLGSGPYWAY